MVESTYLRKEAVPGEQSRADTGSRSMWSDLFRDRSKSCGEDLAAKLLAITYAIQRGFLVLTTRVARV